MATLLSKTSSLLQWCSVSKDDKTDRYTDLVYNASVLYSQLEAREPESKDDSKIFQVKNEPPNLLIDTLTDIFILLLLYIVSNNWTDKFLESLKTKLLEDSANSGNKFKYRRLINTHLDK